MKTLIVPTLLCAGCVALAQAQTASTTSQPPERFRQLDANGDGRISADEWAAGQPSNSRADPAAMFRGLDKDGDGSVSAAELHAARMDRPLPGQGTATNGQTAGPHAGQPGDRPARPHDSSSTGVGGDHSADGMRHPGGGLGGIEGGMGHPGGGTGGPAGMGHPGGGMGGTGGGAGGAPRR